MRTRLFSWLPLLCIILSLSSSANGSESVKRPYVDMSITPPASKDARECSRQQSRVAGRVLSEVKGLWFGRNTEDVEYLHPYVVSKKYNLSTACALHLDNDMFLHQEKTKKENHPNSFKCGLCSKMFRTEKFLDVHLDNRHLHEIPEGLPCLANLCPLIHCKQYEKMENKGYVRKERKVRQKCKDSDMDQRRHKCEALAERCFPRKESRTAAELNTFFKHQFCDAHRCGEGVTPFALGSVRNRINIVYIVVVAIMFFLLAIGYGTFYHQERNTRRAPADLRRVKQLDKVAWHNILLWGGKKKKQY